MSATPDASPSSGRGAGGPRYFVLLGITVFIALVLGLFAAVAFAALLSFVPSIVGLLFGLLLAFGLPIFLAVRANLALKRKNRGLLLRRLVMLFLLGATQLAILGSVLQFTDRGSGHLAAAGAGALHSVGGIPVLSGLLEEHARREQVPLPYDGANQPTGPDGGPVGVGVDGGAPLDGGVAAPHADAGASARADAGAAVAPAGPKLSPRTAGGATVRTLAFAATLQSGAPAVVVAQLAFGGGLTTRIVELSAHAKLGSVTALASAEDGGFIAVLGGTHVVVAKAGRAELIKALSRDAKLTRKAGKGTVTYDLQAVRDVAIGPGGDVLVVADALDPADTAGALVPLLVMLPKGQSTPQILRHGGGPVPGAPDQSVVLGFDLKPARGDGRVVISETFRSGPDEIAPRLQGEEYQLNPQRLFVMRVDQPKVQQEIARTDIEASGVEHMTFQGFADASALADGRVIFDANFVEQGPSGWLFSWRPGGAPVQALSPELIAGQQAAFSGRAPRVKLLDVEPDGAFVFVSPPPDAQLVLSRLQAPRDATRSSAGALAVTRDAAGDKPRGTVSRVEVPFVATGGQWVLALASIDGVGDGLVLASPADLKAGVFEVLLASGQTVATGPGSTVTLSTLKLPVQDELLWSPAPAGGAPVVPSVVGGPDAGAP